MVLRFAGAVFTAAGATDDVITYTSRDAPAKSAVRMLETIGLADRWHPAGPAQVKIRDAEESEAGVAIKVKLPGGTTLAAVAKHLAALGIAVGLLGG